MNAPEYIHAGCLCEPSDLLNALYENHTGHINKYFPYIRNYDACSNNMAMFLHNHIHCRNSGLIIFKYNTGTHENEHHEKASKHEEILYSCTECAVQTNHEDDLKAHINTKATFMGIYSTTLKSIGSLRASMFLNFS